MMSESSPIISFIIPVYNSEKTLERCLESILALSGVMFEIIIVDDGSSDRSLEIENRFSASYDNIRLIHQSNKGPGVARNEGIKKSRGKYIWFVDSDDTILSDNVKTVHSILFKCFDVISFNYVEHRIGGVTRSIVKIHRGDKCKTEISGYAYLQNYILPPYINNGFLWNRLIRRDVIIDNNLLFGTERYQEDMIFLIKVFSNAKNVCYLSECLYCYEALYGLQRKYYPTAYNDLRSVIISLLEVFKAETDGRIQGFIALRTFRNLKFCLIDNFVLSQSLLGWGGRRTIIRCIKSDAKLVSQVANLKYSSFKSREDKFMYYSIRESNGLVLNMLCSYITLKSRIVFSIKRIVRRLVK